LNTEVKQHWALIVLGFETLQEISGFAGTAEFYDVTINPEN
jgi:hypothetical protein